MKNGFIFCILLILSAVGNASLQITSFSQASQDAFVCAILYDIEKKVGKGYYLDIGSGHPTINSNSYFLEHNLHWEGVSLDIAQEYRDPWIQLRQNPLLLEDATRANYAMILQNFPRVIDYLSLDVDGEYATVLKRIPFDQHIFKVITIEHDFYRFGEIHRQAERKILHSLGYYLLCPDVMHKAVGSFEDWWIHPAAFSERGLIKLLSVDFQSKYHDEIVSILKRIAD